MKILVTGGTGLVGSAIRDLITGKVLSKLWNTNATSEHSFQFINSKDADLTDWNSTLAFFTLVNADAVIHLAANVGGLYKNMNQKLKMFEDNLLINLHVVKAARMVGVKYGIACLSTCIYPDKIEVYPIDESVFHNGPPHPSNEGYAYAKRMLEVQCRLTGSPSHSDSEGNVWTCVTPTNLYGPNDNFDLETSHVIPGLIHKCSIAKRENKPFTILGTGKPLRQFLYVSDFADIIVWLLLQKINGHGANLPDMLNIIPDVEDEHSIQHIGEVIADIVGVTEIQNDTSFSDGQFKKTTSNKRLREVLPSTFSFEPIESGLAKTIHWFNTDFLQKVN